MVGGLFNTGLFILDYSTLIIPFGLFNQDYSTQTIQLGLFNSSVKTQLHFTQVFYGLNKMELNNLG